MSSAESASNFSSFCAYPYACFSEKLHEFAIDSNNGMKGFHFIWLTPVNALSNIVGILLTPFFALINLIAAAIFKIISCCSSYPNAQEIWNDAASHNLQAAGDACSNKLGTMFLRIFNPNFDGFEPLVPFPSFTPATTPSPILQQPALQEQS